ncbi:ATP-binding protein [Alistipes sp. OttesenSCG-928-B03]|nr:ATP-binding protein [Alistipes sp. OttesenSCG-928-B03]
MENINWNNIRPINNSLNDGFEEFVCQLAKRESIENKSTFIRKGKPDAGLECYWVLENGEEWGWQAKYFTASLDNSQWTQIDNSIRTAINKHPKLTRLYIAIPIDPPDARLDNQKSMLQKWEDKVQEWENAVSTQGRTLSVIPWWSSDLIQKLQDPRNNGITRFWFNKEDFTDNWFKENINLAIRDLGKRYTPELNLKLDLANTFNGLNRNSLFEKELFKYVDDLCLAGRRFLGKIKTDTIDLTSIEKLLDNIAELYKNVSIPGIGNIPATELRELCRYGRNEISKIDTTPYDYYDRNSISDFLSTLTQLEEYLGANTVSVANAPFLILTGEAGSGKSHLLADVVSERNKNNQHSLFLLGAYFSTEDNPWTQILRHYTLNCTVDEFLYAINAKAEISKQRIVIFIDALNEGKGRLFWSTYLNSFIEKIKQYEWLGLALSIRQTYFKSVISEDFAHDEIFTRCHHYGFQGVEYDAIKLFFGAYDIEMPNIPFLNEEFQNPLFLSLFCKGLANNGIKRIPNGFQGISSVFNYYINSVNKNLSHPTKLDFHSSINIVAKCISGLINYQLTHKSLYIPLDEAYVLFTNLSTKYGVKSGLFEELLHEGIIIKESFFNRATTSYEEVIEITYERMKDYFSAEYILESCKDNLSAAFVEGGTYYYMVESESECSYNKGLVEALSVLVPEKSDIEFHDLVPHIRNSYSIAECFTKSLLWRKHATITNKINEYVNDVVLSYVGTDELFWDTCIRVAAIPEHYCNALKMHQVLSKFSMAERDGWWTIFMRNNYSVESSSIARLIDWALATNDNVNDQVADLTATMLTWFLVSTNRELRDKSTKALVNLLKNNLHALIALLKRFEGVNDPYVYERVFAVAYGCVMRTKQTQHLSELGKYIYNTIFNKKGEIYPHILLRDYARNVIEYALHIGIQFPDIEIKKIRPPYTSSFPTNTPSIEEIDAKYDIDFTSEESKRYRYAQRSILRSMTTEYGRKTGGYGDFGRNVFQSGLSDFLINVDLLSNIAIEWIFDKYGYDVELHGEFDDTIGHGRGRSTIPNERIGKKYQWLAFYEMLARVSDNFPKYTNHYGDKEESYNGPWEPYVRDIDPSLLISKTPENDTDEEEQIWWNIKQELNWEQDIFEWVSSNLDLPSVPELLTLEDNNKDQWLLIEGHLDWNEPRQLGQDRYDNPHKLLWYQIRSYMISKKDFSKYKKWATKQNFMGRWMPEATSVYEVFSREYYWSPAYVDTCSYQESYEVEDRKSGELICEAKPTVMDFMWEEEFDYSKEDKIIFLKPSKFLFEGLKMEYGDIEGVWVDKNKIPICISTSAISKSKPRLLIRKAPLMEYMENNGLIFSWTLIGEKQIVGGRRDDLYGNANYRPIELSGFYYVDQTNKITGNITVKPIRE